MNPETLRRLLLDRAVGQLSDDAGALLDAYLARDPAARAELADLIAAVDAARRAVAEEPVRVTAADVPPFPRRAVQAAVVRSARPRAAGTAGRWLALAAGVALAFLAGHYYADRRGDSARRSPDPLGLVQGGPSRADGPVIVEPDDAGAPRSRSPGLPAGIWHLDPSRLAAAPLGRSPQVEVRWSSPLRRPQIGEVS